MGKKTGFGKEREYVGRTEGRRTVTGLTDGEAAAIRKTAGRNTVHRGKKQNPLKLFAGQLGDLMTMILLVCAGLSVLMGEGTEALAMIVIVLVKRTDRLPAGVPHRTHPGGAHPSGGAHSPGDPAGGAQGDPGGRAGTGGSGADCRWG